MPGGYVNRELRQFEPEILKRRGPQPQNILTEPDEPGSFESAEFVAYIQKPIIINSRGDMEVTLTVTSNFRPYAESLARGMVTPLHCLIQVWKPFQDYLEDINGLV